MSLLYPPELLDALEGLGAAVWSGEIYRHMFHHYPPVRANTSGARWNPPGDAAIYASLERETAVAEGEWAIAIQPLRPKATRTIYRVRVRLNQVVVLTDPHVLATVGLTPELIRDDDFVPCQRVGGAVRWLGNDGLLVPSARAPGTNLVIYPRDGLDFEVLASEVLDE